MKTVRSFLVALSALALGFACDRSPTGPPQPSAPSSPLFSSSSSQTAPTGLLSCSALPYESVTPPVGPEGGTISIGAHCFKAKLKFQAPARSNYAVAW